MKNIKHFPYKNKEQIKDVSQLQKQMLIFDYFLPQKRQIQIPILTTLLAYDTTAYKTVQQIKLQNKDDKNNSQRSKVLYKRANKLQVFIQNGKKMLEHAFQQFNKLNQISLELSQIKQKQQQDNHNIMKVNNQPQRQILKLMKQDKKQYSYENKNFIYQDHNTQNNQIQIVLLNNQKKFNQINKKENSKSNQIKNNNQIKDDKPKQNIRDSFLNKVLLQKQSIQKRKIKNNIISQSQQNFNINGKNNHDSHNSYTYANQNVNFLNYQQKQFKKVEKYQKDRNKLYLNQEEKFKNQISNEKKKIITKAKNKSKEQQRQKDQKYQKQISQLKRPQYHKKSIILSDLKVLQQQNKQIQSDIKNQRSQRLTLEDCLNSNRIRTPKIMSINTNIKTYRDQTNVSLSPKIQIRKSISPLHLQIQQNKQLLNIQKINTQQYLQKPKKNKQQYFKSQQLYEKKQQVSIYVQTDDIDKEQYQSASRKSLQLLNKFAKKTDKSFIDIEKQINLLKQKVSQMNQSRVIQRRVAQRIEKYSPQQKQKTKGSLSNNGSISITMNLKNQGRQSQFFSDPPTVEQQQMWQCQEDQLEEEIKQLNQKISHRNLHKNTEQQFFQQTFFTNNKNNVHDERMSVPLRKTQRQSKSPKLSNKNLTQRISHLSNGNTKCVRLDLTPDKNNIPRTPRRAKQKYKETNLQIQIQDQRMLSKPQTNRSCTPKVVRVSCEKSFIHKQFMQDNLKNCQQQQKQCGKWDKKSKGTKQLLSAKIANLRQ